MLDLLLMGAPTALATCVAAYWSRRALPNGSPVGASATALFAILFAWWAALGPFPTAGAARYLFLAAALALAGAALVGALRAPSRSTPQNPRDPGRRPKREGAPSRAKAARRAEGTGASQEGARGSRHAAALSHAAVAHAGLTK